MGVYGETNFDFPDVDGPGQESMPANWRRPLSGLIESITVTPDSSEKVGKNTIPPTARNVICAAVTNDANDFVVLPSLAKCPNGHTITIVGPTATAVEVRTPAGSNEEINSEDCDGTKEYLMGSANTIHIFRKINDTIGWMGQGFTAIGAVVTAVVPD